jgi:hypothetical protein
VFELVAVSVLNVRARGCRVFARHLPIRHAPSVTNLRDACILRKKVQISRCAFQHCLRELFPASHLVRVGRTDLRAFASAAVPSRQDDQSIARSFALSIPDLLARRILAVGLISKFIEIVRPPLRQTDPLVPMLAPGIGSADGILVLVRQRSLNRFRREL